MAGDLFIEDLPYEAQRMFELAGARMGKIIQHSDRSWYNPDSHQKLRAQLITDVRRDRKNLPPHAYLKFPKDCIENSNLDIEKKKLVNSSLFNVSRPLGVVKQQVALANWPASRAERITAGETFLIDLLDTANRQFDLELEFYLLDRSPLEIVFPGGYREKGDPFDWERVKEH